MHGEFSDISVSSCTLLLLFALYITELVPETPAIPKFQYVKTERKALRKAYILQPKDQEMGNLAIKLLYNNHSTPAKHYRPKNCGPSPICKSWVGNLDVHLCQALMRGPKPCAVVVSVETMWGIRTSTLHPAITGQPPFPYQHGVRGVLHNRRFKQDPASYNIILKCPGYNWKSFVISRTQLEWEQSRDANTETTQMLELSEKDFKVAIIKMLQWAFT